MTKGNWKKDEIIPLDFNRSAVVRYYKQFTYTIVDNHLVNDSLKAVYGTILAANSTQTHYVPAHTQIQAF